MTSELCALICKRFSALIGHEFKLDNLRDAYSDEIGFDNDIELFIENLQDKAQKIDLAFLKNQVHREDLSNLLHETEHPILVFRWHDKVLIPTILYYTNDELNVYEYDNGSEILTDEHELVSQTLYTDPTGHLPYLVPLSMHPIVSDDENTTRQTDGAVSRLFNLLRAEKKEILYVYFYAVLASLIRLALPIGIQAVIELISGGVVFNSIILLISFVILAILTAGGLEVMQYTLVEVLQRRVFVKAAFEFSYRLPKVRAEALLGHYAPELMNRFFDVLTIQKSLPKLLIDLTGSVLQILLGLILLSFYHPFFVFFGLTLIGLLSFVFYTTGSKGLRSSLIESKYKYKVVHWLEEIARTLYSFKLAGHTQLPLQKMDTYVNNYLHYRKKHFQVLMSQFVYIIGFKTLVTGGLLTIGTWLVVERQITLGQFVATEIVIILTLGAVEKLILNMSMVYDLLTAVEKVGTITDLRLEKKGGITIPTTWKNGIGIKIRNLYYHYPETNKVSLNNISLDIAAGERVCFAGFNGSGKNTLVRILSGLLDGYQGMIALNNVSLKDININSLRDNIAKNVSQEDIFDGTVLDNISMGKPRVKYQDVLWALENVGLMDFVNGLPEGLQTELIAGGKRFSASVATRMILARCIAERPKILILNDMLHDLDKSDKLRILSFLTDKRNPWTLICISNDPLIFSTCDKIIVLRDGQVHLQGTYPELAHDEYFKECLIYQMPEQHDKTGE